MSKTTEMFKRAEGLLELASTGINAELKENGDGHIHAIEQGEYAPKYVPDIYGGRVKNTAGETKEYTNHGTVILRKGERLDALSKVFQIKQGMLYHLPRRAFVGTLKVRGAYWTRWDKDAQLRTEFVAVSQKWDMFKPETYLVIQQSQPTPEPVKKEPVPKADEAAVRDILFEE